MTLEGGRKPDGPESAALVYWGRFKAPRAWGLAEAAQAIFREVPGREGIPISPDEFFPTCMAIGAATFFIVHIAGINIPKAVVHRDRAGQ